MPRWGKLHLPASATNSTFFREKFQFYSLPTFYSPSFTSHLRSFFPDKILGNPGGISELCVIQAHLLRKIRFSLRAFISAGYLK